MLLFVWNQHRIFLGKTQCKSIVKAFPFPNLKYVRKIPHGNILFQAGSIWHFSIFHVRNTAFIAFLCGLEKRILITALHKEYSWNIIKGGFHIHLGRQWDTLACF